MQLTIREPGSAITHFIGCLMALIAASPLLMKAHGNSDYFFLQHDPVIRSKHDVSQYLSRIRKGTLLFPQT